MVKRLVVHTDNPQTVLSMIHELGASFFCKTGQDTYKVVYFASNREVHFEGSLSKEQLDQIKRGSAEVTSIRTDEFRDEIIIEEIDRSP